MAIEIKEKESLAPYTSFKVGGPATWFIRVRSYKDLREALEFIKNKQVKFCMIGGGSNILVSDAGYDGCVIKMDDRAYELHGSMVRASAGAVLAIVADECVERGLSGLEWAFGVPGTIGGAVRGNAGAFGYDMSTILTDVEAVHAYSGEVRHFKPDMLEFSYRESWFKRNPEWVITQAALRLRPDSEEQCRARLEKFLEEKKAHQPLGEECAGCIFKNPPTSQLGFNSEVPLEFLQRETISAGLLIDRANLKNHLHGQAKVSGKHGNFILNIGGATAKEIQELINIIKDKVHEKFGIVLQEEIQYIK